MNTFDSIENCYFHRAYKVWFSYSSSVSIPRTSTLTLTIFFYLIILYFCLTESQEIESVTRINIFSFECDRYVNRFCHRKKRKHFSTCFRQNYLFTVCRFLVRELHCAIIIFFFQEKNDPIMFFPIYARRFPFRNRFCCCCYYDFFFYLLLISRLRYSCIQNVHINTHHLRHTNTKQISCLFSHFNSSILFWRMQWNGKKKLNIWN